MKATPNKLLAEWFWTDRWMGSSGFLLPMLARGLYREMLTQAWRRGAKLPNDPETIRRAIGATELEWAQGWPLVSKFWRVDANNNLVNDTQIEVYQQAQSIQRVRSEAGRIGGLHSQAKRQANVQANGQAKLNPPSPSPSPSPITVSESVSDSEKEKKITTTTNGNGNGHKRPIYQSERFVIFEWQVEQLSRMLGPSFTSFDVFRFFDTLSQDPRQIIPPNKKGSGFQEWLESEFVREAERRGMTFAEPPHESKLTKQLKQSSQEFLSRGAGPKAIRSNV